VVNRNTKAIRYFLGANGYTTTNTAAELNALRASFAQWQAISGTVLKFEEGGLAFGAVDVNTSDNTNVVFWSTDTMVDGGNSDISGRLGVTFSSFFNDGTFAEADIVLNAAENEWSADFFSTNTARFFVEGVALHEMGHFIGLSHSPVGAATMFWAGGPGTGTQVGLSTDELCAARLIYAATNHLSNLGALRGQVTRLGSPVFGSAVFAEDTNGVLVAGTVTDSSGQYQLFAMPPGNYQVRSTPLDAPSASAFLARGWEIDFDFSAADSSFLPTTNIAVSVLAGTNTLNFAVASGGPLFRITEIRYPTTTGGSYQWNSVPITLRQGQSNFIIGVAAANLPTSGATLSISGTGITVGNTIFNANIAGLNFISANVSVASNAPPGPRTLTVVQGANRAYANGFLDIVPVAPDYNFDGLDDTFQRRHFPLFTATNAAPTADPDGDTMPNASEYIAATNPTNAASLMKIDSVVKTVNGATITFRSVSGKHYQLYGRALVASGSWQPIGSLVTAGGATAQASDTSGVLGEKFYRVVVLP
ncbi:MAG TPA: matrixin family metalloprotease, partial [Candidatus Acidoferrum sp.]|nr:matrixin family metalloprotease [Candidatus Acidoferrum sp.]